MAQLMDLINVYETTADNGAAEEVLDGIIGEVQEAEGCTEKVAIEFAYMLKLAKANDQKLPGKYILQRLFSYIKMAMAISANKEG